MLQGGDEHEQTTQRPIVCSIQLPPGLPEQAALDLQVVCAAVRPAKKAEQVIQCRQRRIDGRRIAFFSLKVLFPGHNGILRNGLTVQKQ